MTDLLIAMHDAGVPCRELKCWVECADGYRDRCSECRLEGPDSCDEGVIRALVKIIVGQAKQVDEVLGQRDYWKNVADKMCNRYMARERLSED